MEPFRYSFETDEQYQARIQDLKTETETVPSAPSGAPQSRTGFVLPWWVIAIFVAIVLVVLYRENRKKLIRQMRREQEQSRPRFPNQML